ncbi:hypothetical protein MRX96_009540 [Rhipicephalus microplus]
MDFLPAPSGGPIALQQTSVIIPGTRGRGGRHESGAAAAPLLITTLAGAAVVYREGSIQAMPGVHVVTRNKVRTLFLRQGMDGGTRVRCPIWAPRRRRVVNRQ